MHTNVARQATVAPHAGMARARVRGRARDVPAVALLAALPALFLHELPGGLPPYGGDILVHVYPLLSLLAHGLHAGRPTLWNPYAAGGYPLAPYGALALYPPVLLALLLLPVTGALALLYALYLAVLGVGTYLLAGDLGQSRPARLLAAATLAYGGFVAAHAYAGHIFELGAVCPLPLAYLLLRRAILHRRLAPAVWCGAVVGLMVLAAGAQFLPFALAPLPLLALWHTLRRPSPTPPPLRAGHHPSSLTRERGRTALTPRPPLPDAGEGETPTRPTTPSVSAYGARDTTRQGGPPLLRQGGGVVSYGIGGVVRAVGGGGRLWPLAALAVAGLAALALGAVYVLPFAEILPWTLRAGAVPLPVATAQSLPWYGLIALVAPDGLGNAAAGTYWPASRFSPYFHEIYAYAGLLPLLLAPVALVRRQAARPYGLLALLALLAMLGGNTPLYGLLYHLPGAGLFRAPARAGLVLDVALALLAGFGLDALRDPSWRRGRLSLALAPGVAVGLAVLGALLAVAALAGHGQGIPDSARALAFGGAARLTASLLIGLAACLGVAGAARASGERPRYVRAVAYVVPALALLDLCTANGALLRPADPAPYYSAAVGVLSPRDPSYRVLAPDNPAPAVPLGLCMVTRACYDVQDAAPLALDAYWRLGHPSVVRRARGRVSTGRDTALDADPFFLRLFGVRTLYSASPLPVPGLRPAGGVTSRRWAVPGGADWNVHSFVARSQVYENPAALPRTFVAPRAVSVPDETAALHLLEGGTVDPRRVAVLSPAPGPATGPAGAVMGAWAGWLAADGDNTLVVRADGGASGGYLVVDDGWFPGWAATVDWHAAPVLRADYLLRAVQLPPGRHLVRLVYAPPAYLLGAAVTLATALALLAFAAVILIRRHRRHLVVRVRSTRSFVGIRA